MRLTFILLVLANVAVLILFQVAGGRTQHGESAGHEPYQADKVKIVPPPAPVSAVASNEPQPVEAPAAPPVPPAPPGKAAAPAPAKPVGQCLEWQNLADADLDRARQALQGLKLADKASFRKSEKVTGYWVYVPPRASLADAQKKVGELKARGVGDIFILQENTAMRFAISLGVFSTEAAATNYLAQLREKGVRSAISGPRNRAGEGNVALLRGVDAGVAPQLAKLATEFSASEVHPVECR